ncbi:hypothetical protein [Rathayibacter iranicus]|nr:hypothetical protein [Rathayibacter iranicus]
MDMSDAAWAPPSRLLDELCIDEGCEKILEVAPHELDIEIRARPPV